MEAAELAELLETGVAMLGASAGAELLPEAFRVWGASVDGAGRLRALVSTAASRTLADVREGSRLAFVLTDVTTFRSVQVKGPAVGAAELPGPVDLACMRRYDQAFGAVLARIGHPPSLREALRPTSVLALTAEIDRVFDQTPGPGAGRELGAAGRA